MEPLLDEAEPTRQRKSSDLQELSTYPTPILPTELKVEEETLPFYDPQHYYPVQIGDVYQSEYKVIGKLGYGAYSTVWLCRRLGKHEYVALKISTYLPDFTFAGKRELNVYKHLSAIESTHPGRKLFRQLFDSFELKGAYGPHQCLVQQPMYMSLLDMMELVQECLDLPVLKTTLLRLLRALDFLHTEAKVIHTDIKWDNIMLTIEDPTMCDRFADAEIETPSPRKLIDTRAIYLSRRFSRPQNKTHGLPMLCDFGEARIGKVQTTKPRPQPHIYRAPEVILEMPWGPAIDIWNVGCLIWDLFEGEHLFHDIFDDDGHYDPYKHLALMVSLIGPPPSEFVKQSETASKCFDESGNWIAETHAKLPADSLESLEDRLDGEEKERFLGFVRSMLRWPPEERKTAYDLLQDRWIFE